MPISKSSVVSGSFVAGNSISRPLENETEPARRGGGGRNGQKLIDTLIDFLVPMQVFMSRLDHATEKKKDFGFSYLSTLMLFFTFLV